MILPAGAAGPARFFERLMSWTRQLFISDGYRTLRSTSSTRTYIVKLRFDACGGPGQFNTPHGIAVDAKGFVYVADRGNARIQVLDNDLNYVREIKYQPAVDANLRSPIPDFGRDQQGTPRSLWPNTLCITPGPTQHIYTHDMLPGQIQKFTLDNSSDLPGLRTQGRRRLALRSPASPRTSSTSASS
jgi:hypothetical protein